MNAMPPRATAAKGMQGADRVAAILLTMGKSLAGRLMKHFDPDEIKRITRSAADLKPVPAPALGGLIEEFATQFALGASLVGNAGEVERMLDGVLPKEQIAEIMGDLAGNPDRSIWERISASPRSSLAGYMLARTPADRGADPAPRSSRRPPPRCWPSARRPPRRHHPPHAHRQADRRRDHAHAGARPASGVHRQLLARTPAATARRASPKSSTSSIASRSTRCSPACRQPAEGGGGAEKHDVHLRRHRQALPARPRLAASTRFRPTGSAPR